MEYQSFQPPPRRLMGPGPSDVPERILEAMARPTVGHLDPSFVGLMDEIKGLLQYAFRTSNTMTMPVSGPGTAGMESCVVNLVEPGEKVIVCRNGVFGGRLMEMASRTGAQVVAVDDEWGEPASPDRLAQALEDHPDASVVTFVHAETSTGALSDAETLIETAHRYDCLVIVDAVTSLGGSPLRVDEWGADAVYAGSQKCLSCTPGLSPLTFGERAVEKVRGRETPVRSWFMDVSLVMNYWGSGSKRSYHHTAPINALYGLHEALLILHEEGIENAWERHRRNHKALGVGLEALGLSFMVDEPARIPQLNAVTVPDSVDEARVRGRLLEEHQLEIGAGLGPMAGKIWRIGLMGHSSRPDNVEHCIKAMAAVLTDEGMTVSGPEAIEASRDVLAAST